MNYTNKIISLADRFEIKLRKYAEFKPESSTETGVHFEVLFVSLANVGSNDPTKDPGAVTRRDNFVASFQNDAYKKIEDLVKKYKIGLYLPCLIDIKVGSAANTGSIAMITGEIVPIYPGSPSDDEKRAVAKVVDTLTKEAMKVVIASGNDMYKKVMGKDFAGRAQELNAANKFPLNAEQPGAGFHFNFEIQPAE